MGVVHLISFGEEVGYNKCKSKSSHQADENSPSDPTFPIVIRDILVTTFTFIAFFDGYSQASPYSHAYRRTNGNIIHGQANGYAKGNSKGNSNGKTLSFPVFLLFTQFYFAMAVILFPSIQSYEF
jgi:hypothetical protein